MATANYVLIQRISLSTSASSVTFSGIPQTGYTDLKVVVSARTTGGFNSNTIDSARIYLYNNSTIGTNTAVCLFGNGSSATSDTTARGIFICGSANTANTFGQGEAYIPNYTSSTAKSIAIDGTNETAATAAYPGIEAMISSLTSPVNKIYIAPESATTFVQYSTFSLYGLVNTTTTPTVAPYASGGDIIQTDGTYWYHAFLGSGYFTPNKALSCDVLVVAGGGGGGSGAQALNNGGGGGAGGLVALTSQNLTANTQQIVSIGAGGAADVSGTNSSFSSNIAIGGGRGGNNSQAALTGGSGGGGAFTGSYTAGANGTPSQGSAGGTTNGAAPYQGGGGGGASAAGSSGAGGNGSLAYSSWLSVTNLGQNVSGTYYIAGGGAPGGNTAGTPGYGGGGNSNNSSASVVGSAGTPNTGGGGGGGGSQGAGVPAFAGGSGVVIVRYAV
jgi:hypothetical protein